MALCEVLSEANKTGYVQCCMGAIKVHEDASSFLGTLRLPTKASFGPRGHSGQPAQVVGAGSDGALPPVTLSSSGLSCRAAWEQPAYLKLRSRLSALPLKARTL